jgi:hypothetical protein
VIGVGEVVAPGTGRKLGDGCPPPAASIGQELVGAVAAGPGARR